MPLQTTPVKHDSHSACVVDVHAIFLCSIRCATTHFILHIRHCPCQQLVSHPVQMHAAWSSLQHNFSISLQDDFTFRCCHCQVTCCWHEASALLLDALRSTDAAIKSPYYHCSALLPGYIKPRLISKDMPANLNGCGCT